MIAPDRMPGSPGGRDERPARPRNDVEIDASADHSSSELRRLVTLGVALGCAVAILQALLHLTNAALLDHRFAAFELEEGGFVTWAASSATIAAATVALLLSFVDPAQRVRGPVVALALAFVSFDDTIILHERLAFRLTDEASISASYAQVVWPSIYLPLLVATAILLIRIAHATRAAERVVLGGLGILASAVALEVIGIAFERGGVDPEGWPRMTVIALEEGAEVAGWMLVATGLAFRLVTLARAPQAAAQG